MLSPDRRVKYQAMQLPAVAAAGNTVELPGGKTDINYKHVTGFAIGIVGDTTGINQSTLEKFTVDGYEVFPEDYPASGLMSSADVPPDERYFSHKDKEGKIVPYRAEGSAVNIKYTDGSFAGVAYPYTVIVWLRLENPKTEEK